MPDEATPEGYRPVRRVLAILNALVASDEPMRLVELSREIQAPNSSAHLLLKEMVNAGLVVADDDRRYAPGPTLIGLSLQVVHQQRIVNVAKPIMRLLMQSTGEDVYIALPLDHSIAYADRILSQRSLHLEIEIGAPRPLHATAVGQLYLAMLPGQEQDELLGSIDLSPITEFTITRRDALRKRLEQVRGLGYAITDQENFENVIGMAAPVRSIDGRMAAALSLSVVRGRGIGHEPDLIRRLCAAAGDLTRLITKAP